MQVKPQTVRAVPRDIGAAKSVSMHGLSRLTVWGVAAAGALLIAVLATRGDVGTQRTAGALTSLSGGSVALVRPDQAPDSSARASDPQAETRRLTEAMRGLTAQNDQIKTRLAAVEHTMDDMTGSITQQIAAAKAEVSDVAQHGWPDNTPTVPATSADLVAMVNPVAPLNPLVLSPQAPTVASTASGAQYGVDIGSALSIKALHARWEGIRSAHPQLLDGLQPIVSLREIPRSNRVELRLVVGPLPSVDEADRLCAALAAYKMYCQPTGFDGQHASLE
jgi:hypothetical protein